MALTVIVPNTPASIQHDAIIKGYYLDGDVFAPGANKYYGTNGSGVKGWQDQIAGKPETTVFNVGGTVLSLTHVGLSTNTYIQNGAGDFTLTVGTENKIIGFKVQGNNATITPANSYKITIIDTDGYSYHVMSQIMNLLNNTMSDIYRAGNLPTFNPVAPGTMTWEWSNMNFYGTAGFLIMANPV